MDKQIKEYADQRDLTSLKYIFVDSLDVDPTFERYAEAYNYCKSIPGLLEQHEELTPFTDDHAMWTETYWARLKMDLKKNFSDQRMSHMREVAKVLLADKIQKILDERKAAASSSPAAPAQPAAPKAVPIASAPQKLSASAPSTPRSTLPTEEEGERARQKEKEKIEADYRSVRNQEEAEKRKLEERKKKLERENQSFESQQKRTGLFSKKVLGVAIAVAAVVVALFLLLNQRNPM